MDGDPDLAQFDSSLDNGSDVEKNNNNNHLDEEKRRKDSHMFPHLLILLISLIQFLFTGLLLSYDTFSRADIFEVALS